MSDEDVELLQVEAGRKKRMSDEDVELLQVGAGRGDEDVELLQVGAGTPCYRSGLPTVVRLCSIGW